MNVYLASPNTLKQSEYEMDVYILFNDGEQDKISAFIPVVEFDKFGRARCVILKEQK